MTLAPMGVKIVTFPLVVWENFGGLKPAEDARGRSTTRGGDGAFLFEVFEFWPKALPLDATLCTRNSLPPPNDTETGEGETESSDSERGLSDGVGAGQVSWGKWVSAGDLDLVLRSFKWHFST